MPTPPTLVANNGLAALATSPRSFTSITWLTGDIIIVAQVDEGNSTENFPTAPTVSGLTFANLITHAASGNCALAVWTATAASGGSGAISASGPSTSTRHWNAWLWQWRGSSGLGNTATQFTSTETVALTPAGGADSAIIWVVGDWAAAASPIAMPTSPNQTTRQAAQDGSLYSYVTTDITDQTSAGSVSYGVNYTSAGPFSIAVVEIKGTSVAAFQPDEDNWKQSTTFLPDPTITIWQ